MILIGVTDIRITDMKLLKFRNNAISSSEMPKDAAHSI